MSETPGQVLLRVLTEQFGDAPPAGYDWPGFAHDAGADWDAVAAAFLAEWVRVKSCEKCGGAVGVEIVCEDCLHEELL